MTNADGRCGIELPDEAMELGASPIAGKRLHRA
jgi:hypothetical protein